MNNKNVYANSKFEEPIWQKNYVVIGVDEVGRGALSGPMFVGAACLDKSYRKEIITLGIKDSKLLSKTQRERIAPVIKKNLLGYSIFSVSVRYINKCGIMNATKYAFKKVVDNLINKLGNKKYFVLLDGYEVVKFKNRFIRGQQAIIDGDAKSITIASAAVIAKVKRDAYMDRLSDQYPQYNWQKNKGYGTREHIWALKKYGKTRHHRDLYIRNFIKKANYSR